MGVSGREREREREGEGEGEREWRPAMTTWRGGREPQGQRDERVWESGEQREGEEGQVALLIMGQISGAGHTWLLPGRCGVSLHKSPTVPNVWFINKRKRKKKKEVTAHTAKQE